MDDEIKAQRLAAWLDSPAGTDPPEDLDPEVLGAVWALVPDRAPAPRVSIDDIFSLVTEGPFAAPRVAAVPEASTPGEVVRFPGNVGDEASGEWDAEDLTHVVPTGPARLVAHPGGKAEGGAEKAAAPVAATPVAATPVAATPAVTKMPAARPTPAAPVAGATRSAGASPRRAPSRAWMMPAVGLALAAAAATLIIVPNMGELSPAADPAAMETARDMQARPASKSIAELAEEGNAPSAEPAPEAGGQLPAPVASPQAQAPAAVAEERAAAIKDQAPAAPAGRAASGGEVIGGLARESDGDAAEKKEAPPPPPSPIAEMERSTASATRSRDAEAPASWGKVEQAPATPSAATQGYGSTSSTSSTASAPTTSAPGRSQSAEVPSDKSRTYIPETAGPSAPREAADDSLLDATAYEEDEDEESLPVTRTETAKQDRAGKGGAKPSVSKRSESLFEESDAGDAPTASAPRSAPTPDASNVLTASARDDAWPSDYDSAWYRALADVAPAFDAARADEAAGRLDAALARYRTLTADTRPTVSQDASLRAAKALKALGRNREALAAADAGLNRSGANTPFRSALYAIRGDLLVLLGRAGEAEAAWASAATLNESR